MLIKNYNSTYLIISRFINLLGSGIYNISIPLYLLNNTGSIVKTSIFFSSIQIPMIILLPFLGVWIEKYNLKYCLVVSNLISLFLFLSLLLFLSEGDFQYYVLLVLSALGNICSSVFDIASQSIFVRLIAQDKIERVNGIKSLTDNLSYLISPTLGTIIYGVLGIYATIIINVLSYLFSVLFLSFLRYPKYEKAIKESRVFRECFIDGVKIIQTDKKLCMLFLLVMILNFLVSPTEEVFSPGIMKTVHHFSDELYGLSSSAVSAGIIAASVWIGYKGKGKKSIKTYFYIQSILMIGTGCFSFIMLDRYSTLFYMLYLFLSFLCGFYSTFINVPLISHFQIAVAPDYQTRFFSLLKFSSYLMIPFGTIFAGQLSAYFRSDIAYTINGFIMAIAVFLMFRKIE